MAADRDQLRQYWEIGTSDDSANASSRYKTQPALAINIKTKNTRPGFSDFATDFRITPEPSTSAPVRSLVTPIPIVPMARTRSDRGDSECLPNSLPSTPRLGQKRMAAFGSNGGASNGGGLVGTRTVRGRWSWLGALWTKKDATAVKENSTQERSVGTPPSSVRLKNSMGLGTGGSDDDVIQRDSLTPTPIEPSSATAATTPMPPEIDVKRFTNGSLPDRDAYDYKSDSVYNSMQRPESSAEGSYFSFAIGPDELQVRPTSSPSADRNVLSVIPMILNPAPFQSDSPSPYPESYMRETPLPNSPTPPSLPSRPVLVPFLSTSSTSSSISSSIHQRDSWRHSFSSNISSILAGPNTASATQDSFSHADGKTSPPATPPNYQYFQQPPPPQTYNNVNAREVGPSSVSYFSGPKSVIPSIVGISSKPGRGNSAVITESLVGGFGGVSPRRTSLVFAMDEELRSRTLGRDSLASANGGVGGVDLLLAEEDEDEEDNYEPSLVEAVIAGGSEC